MTNATYQSIPVQECGESILDLSNFPFIIDPQYFQMGHSETPKLYARAGVIHKLLAIQNKLNGLSFKIWDAWRPRLVQKNIYQKCWDDLQSQHPGWNEEQLRIEVGVFVTSADDLKRVPPHATGGALDLTLVDAHGQELAMGTSFDHFGPESSIHYFDSQSLDSLISTNRRLLRDAMYSEGFSSYEDEWWHFDFGNQFWAFQTQRSFAIYGEMVSPQQKC